MDAPLTCPKCGLQQRAAPECASCGLIFAKYRPEASRPHGSSLQTIDRRYAAPIGLGGRALRGAFGLLALGIGFPLAMAGVTELGFPGYVVLVALGALALYFVLSSLLDRGVSRNRFYTEALVFLAALAGLRLGLPALFDEGAPPPPPRAPAPARQAAQAPLDELRAAVQALTREARGHLAAGDDTALARCCIEEGPLLLERLEHLSPPERLRAQGLARAIRALAEAVAREDGAEPDDAVPARLDAVERELEALGGQR